MNCTTIVKTASHSADYLHLNAYLAANRYSRDFDHSNGFLTNHVGCSIEQQPTQCSLLEGLPCEILGMIVQIMDLKSFWAFASVNRHLRASICSLRVIRDTQKSFAVSYALRRLIKADTGNAFTITDFEATLTSKTCTSCHAEKEFAPFLNLATCQRICFACSQFERAHTPKKLARLPYLDSSNNTFQVNDGKVCEGCTRDQKHTRGSGSTARARSEKVYLEDQFLEHFNKCETAWKIAVGQRMTVHDEWWPCQRLRLRVKEVWGSTPPASSMCAAIRDLEYAEDLTPEAFKAEYERLERILSEAKAQEMMEIESREKDRNAAVIGAQKMEADVCFTLETCIKQLNWSQ